MVKKIVLLLGILFIFIPQGCSVKKPENLGSGKLKAYASFYAMYDFALTIGGDKADIILLVPPGSEPHEWEPGARDIASLENAGLLIYNGHNMEHFISSIKNSVKNKDLLYIETGKDIAASAGDPHIWLDPMNAKKQYEIIKDAFCEKDPVNKDFYEANYQAAADKLDILDDDYRLAAENFTKKDLVVSHEAYGYLCAAYGLNQVGINGIMADTEPSLARIAEIIEFIKENNVTVIFTDELSSSRTVDAIAAETGAKVETLSTFEAGTSDYITVMYENLNKLKKALSE